MSIETVIQTIAVFAIPVLFAISLHEAAHGYVARYFGDSTAADQGRLSINPLRHIDPFGTIILPLVLHLMTLPPIGYAKPVPVDYANLRNPKKQMAFVAAAGPMANFAMGFGWLLFSIALMAAGSNEAFFYKMAQAGISVNAAMCVFNLIPIPPLDGGRIMTGILPMSLARPYASIERYSLFVFIGLIILMQMRALDGVLFAGIKFVVGIFMLLATPFTYLLS